MLLLAVLLASANVNSLGRAQYVARADAMCRTAVVQAARIPRLKRTTTLDWAHGSMTAVDFADVSRYLKAVFRVVDPLTRRLHALPLPKGDRLLRRWWSARGRDIEDLHALRTAALTQARAAFARVTSASALDTARFVQVSGRLGFKACQLLT